MSRLIVFAVLIGVVLWALFGRRRDRAAQDAKPAEPQPQQMLACAHCGVHLPKADAAFDAAGRPYCSEAHRLAGPR